MGDNFFGIKRVYRDVYVFWKRSGLSEGEWQRLQLARFLMRADVAKLLVLDEPFKGVCPSDAYRMLATLGAHARATGQVCVALTSHPHDG